jgi:DDE_Tnp_1-associated
MEKAAAEFGAISEAVVFLDYFKDFTDFWQRGKVIYPLDEVRLLCLLTVLGGRGGDVRRHRAVRREEGCLLRRFRPLRDGTPSHDHLGDIFAPLDVEEFQRCFVAWVSALTGASADVIAIDGNLLRRSYQKKGTKAPIHMVSAFAARQRLVLGQVNVAEKSGGGGADGRRQAGAAHSGDGHRGHSRLVAAPAGPADVARLGEDSQRFQLAQPVGMAGRGLPRRRHLSLSKTARRAAPAWSCRPSAATP